VLGFLQEPRNWNGKEIELIVLGRDMMKVMSEKRRMQIDNDGSGGSETEGEMRRTNMDSNKRDSSILMNSSVCRYVRAIQHTLYHHNYNYTNTLLIAGDFRIVSYFLLFIFRCDEVMQETQRNKQQK